MLDDGACVWMWLDLDSVGWRQFGGGGKVVSLERDVLVGETESEASANGLPAGMDACDGVTKLSELSSEPNGLDLFLHFFSLESVDAVLELSHTSLSKGIGFDDLSILGDVLSLEMFKVLEDGLHVGHEEVC